MRKNMKMALLGLVTGIANGFFGSGGGIVAVPMLKKTGLEPKKAHACSLAITLPLSVISAVFYSFGGKLDFKSALMCIPFGLAGALIGTKLMRKISVRLLSAVFGLLLIAAGARGLMK